MRAIVNVGPTLDQDGIIAVAVINDLSITVVDRPGPCLIIASIGFVELNATAEVVVVRLLQEGVLVPGAIITHQSGSDAGEPGHVTLMALVAEVPTGATFTVDVTGITLGVDIKAGNARLLVLALGREEAVVSSLVSP